MKLLSTYYKFIFNLGLGSEVSMKHNNQIWLKLQTQIPSKRWTSDS
jgi:hypothetical protein